MKDFLLLSKLRLYQWKNLLFLVRQESKLKIFIILFFALFLWGGLFFLFYRAFLYLKGITFFSSTLVATLFALFFFALWIMLTFSNAIILYSSLFASSETDSLLSRPLLSESIFLYNLTTGIFFSSWAFLFLAAPLLGAFGYVYQVPLHFYLYAFGFCLFFLPIPAALGGGICLLASRLLPRVKKQLVLGVILFFLIFSLYKVWQIRSLEEEFEKFSPEWLQALFAQFSFAKHTSYPSYWLTEALLAAASGDSPRSRFLLLYLATSSIFFTYLVYLLSSWLYRPTYDLIRSFQGSKTWRPFFLYPWMRKGLFFLPKPLQVLVLKDIQIFFRDPVQWSQLFIFLGLLTLYILNLRSLEYHLASGTWKVFVTYLNFMAVSLTLATFTNRFIYPQVSLEGKRLWILMVCPIRRRDILFGKFLFTFGLTCLLGEGVTLLSSYMILAPWDMILATAFLMVLLCLGLTGISVGIGALYPQFHEDNPSKITSGFGGTLTLILSLIYVVTLIAAQGILFFLKYQGVLSSSLFSLLLALDFFLSLLLTFFATFLLMYLGIQKFETQEIHHG